MDGHLNKRSRVVGIHNLHPRREIAAHLRQSRLDAIRRVQRIGSGCLPDSESCGRFAIVAPLDIIELGAEFYTSNVLDLYNGPVRVGTNGNIRKLLRGFKKVLHDDGDIQVLPFYRRCSTELPCGNLYVVGSQGQDYIFDRQAVLGELVGIQPDSHRILGAETLDLTDPGDAGQHLLQAGLGIVLQIVFVHASVFGDQADDDQVIPRGFANCNAGALNHLGEAGHRELELVLHLGPRNVRISSRLEGQLKAGGASRITRAGKIQHVVKTRHLLLDDLGHAVFHCLRRRPRIEGLNGDGWRSNGWVLGNG